MKEDCFARMQDYLVTGKDILARELQREFLARGRDFLASKEVFLAKKKQFFTRKQDYHRRDEDYFTRERDFLEEVLIASEELYMKLDLKKVLRYMEWITDSLTWKSILQIVFTNWQYFPVYIFSRFTISLYSRWGNTSRFDVFLSFRGKDVRKTVVDHLFPALRRAGLRVFLDSNNLKKGELIWPALERAMKKSAICIPIFSQGFADSAWCLKEATAMLETPGLIVPLFYGVEPSVVRYPLKDSSPYKKSFIKHYSHPDRQPKEEVDRWKHALGEICSRSGWTMDITEDFKDLVEKVVKDVVDIIRERNFSMIEGYV